jgi:hypothetical protein
VESRGSAPVRDPSSSGHRAPAASRPPARTRTCAYFDEIRDRFDDVTRRLAVVERRYDIGGRVIVLRFAGEDLVAPLTRALSHLPAAGAAEPSLRILVADARAFTPAPPPWDRPARVPAGDDRDVRPALHASDGPVHALLELGRGTLSMYDAVSRTGLFWAESAEALPYYERGAPLRAILHWWALEHGWHMAHAAAVGAEAGGALLVGKGGSGKSTAALACAAAGLTYVGDNDVLVDSGPTPYVHGLYCSAKLDPAHRRTALPRLDELVADHEAWSGGKELFFLDGALGGSVSRGVPLKAVLLPRVTTADRTAVRRVSAAEALLKLAPSTLLQLPGSRAERLGAMASLLQRVPAFALEMGPDVDLVAPAVRAALAEA